MYKYVMENGTSGVMAGYLYTVFRCYDVTILFRSRVQTRQSRQRSKALAIITITIIR
ncbi:hypothetical protein [Sporomusa silvacetica]|uniref:hypothetical protein n=1 Tax=Sporomusa silvacetica TaxID=55504 RepID=UPI00146A8D3D|nr:hypothetical protein [Sporomusa silvacetica]